MLYERARVAQQRLSASKTLPASHTPDASTPVRTIASSRKR
jgi:hypothetical protein